MDDTAYRDDFNTMLIHLVDADNGKLVAELDGQPVVALVIEAQLFNQRD